jgi:hypothetical protein
VILAQYILLKVLRLRKGSLAPGKIISEEVLIFFPSNIHDLCCKLDDRLGFFDLFVEFEVILLKKVARETVIIYLMSFIILTKKGTLGRSVIKWKIEAKQRLQRVIWT